MIFTIIIIFYQLLVYIRQHLFTNIWFVDRHQGLVEIVEDWQRVLSFTDGEIYEVKYQLRLRTDQPLVNVHYVQMSFLDVESRTKATIFGTLEWLLCLTWLKNIPIRSWNTGALNSDQSIHVQGYSVKKSSSCLKEIHEAMQCILSKCAKNSSKAGVCLHITWHVICKNLVTEHLWLSCFLVLLCFSKITQTSIVISKYPIYRPVRQIKIPLCI